MQSSIRYTRHRLVDDSTKRSVTLTGITWAHQYARLMDFFHGDWQRAHREQRKFNSQFPKAKRLKFPTPNFIIS